MAGLVAIHQPNFFPWLGYFDKICRADVFVFLDAVDYPRAGSGGMGSWVNRVKIAVQGEASWIRCPVRRMPLGSPIAAAAIDDTQPWRGKLLKTLEINYARAPRFDDCMAFLEPLIRSSESNLATFNISAITAIASRLGLRTRFVRQSSLPAHTARATDLLISLIAEVGGTTYLCGGGAGGYQENHLFSERGIRLEYQSYVLQPYGDPARFVAGLSVIDYLMCDGRPLAERFRND